MFQGYDMQSLNPRQREAVQAISGPVLVLAGAGSGKTSVITKKIAYLVSECGMPAHRIAAVTFTNKAAREMKERVGKLLAGKAGRGLMVSTFHSMGLDMLRKELAAAGLKSSFSIFDSEDSRSLLAELMHRELASAADKIDWVRNRISAYKNQLWLPPEAVTRAETQEDALAAQVYIEYDRHLRAYNAVDFDDLILRPTLLLRENPEVRERWQHKVRYLLVDEYQDTNETQYEMVKLLVGTTANFTAVGDDDQSIYAWRGARPENMAKLLTDYPGLKVVKLEQNYRSTSRILRAANQVIGNNPHVFEKKLWSEHGIGDLIRVLASKSEQGEAERVATDLLNHKLLNRTEFRDYAVLYRGNFQSRLLEVELQKLQIPYRVSGGTSFFSRNEIKDVMAYLRLIINPDDDNAFLRIVNTPRREIGPATLEKLGSYAQQRGCSMLEACGELGLGLHLGERQLQSVQQFAAWLRDTAREVIESNNVSAIRQMLVDIDYEEWLLQSTPTPTQAEKRIENVNQFLTALTTMQDKAEDEDGRDIESVIRRLVLRDILDQQAEADDLDRVQLMTLHAAKGLEFPHVYLMGLEEDLLPHRTSIEEDTIEEERRLMYVGITRARKTLTITYALTRRFAGDAHPTTVSRFLDELPQDDLEWEGKGALKSEEQKKELGRAHMANLRQLLS